jgi:hypothetical protein
MKDINLKISLGKRISWSSALLSLLPFILLWLFLLFFLSGTQSSHCVFKGVWGTSSTNVYAVGGYYEGGGCVIHYDGSGWSRMDTDVQVGLKDVWGESPNHVFAVGKEGTILHYDGARWSGMSSGTNMDLNAVWGMSGEDVFAVGESGTVLHYNGSIWTASDSGIEADLEGVWGRATDDLFAVGGEWGSGGRIYHYNGSDWSLLNTSHWACWHHDVWGTSTEVVVVGESIGRKFPVILHYDGVNWNGIYNTEIEKGGPDYLKGIWGVDSSNIFIAGHQLDYGFGGVVHYNGDSWVWEVTHEVDMVNTILYDVWGSSANSVYAVGSNNVILHYDGSNWSDMSYLPQPWWVTLLLVAAGVVVLTGVGLWLVRRRRRAGAGQGVEL